MDKNSQNKLAFAFALRTTPSRKLTQFANCNLQARLWASAATSGQQTAERREKQT